jgi:predicted nucleic acid-binding protein
MIALDTNVLIDLLGDDSRADAAEASLRLALTNGPVVICDVVLSELTAGLGSGSEVLDVLEDMGVRFAAVDQRAAVRSGEMQRKYNERLRAAGRRPMSPRTVPDFIVGAHALLQCDALITRDDGFFRDYFKGLRVIVPATSPAPMSPS